jgi:purine-binding chemotaxis protein CheW
MPPGDERKVAPVEGAPPAATEEGRYLCFAVAGVTMALDLVEVLAVESLPRITRVPRPRRYVEGLARTRKGIVPVMDLRRRLGLVNPAVDARTKLLVVQVGGRPLGLVVDDVSEIVQARPEPAGDAAAFPGLDPDLIAGLIRMKGNPRPAILPDVGELLLGL